MSSTNTSTQRQWIAEQARGHPERVFTTLHRHLDLTWMQEAYRLTRKDGAAGIDGVTATDYAKDLEANLLDLLARIKSGRYIAPPVRRHHIPKADGTLRPLGIPTFEDKVAQRAIVMLLEPVYEADFLPCAHGFRPGRSAHDALHAVRAGVRAGLRWVLDADISKYFDTISHQQLRKFLDLRIKDGVVRKMLDKWLKAGVLDKGVLLRPGKGTPQGGVVTPQTQKVTSPSSESASSPTRLDIRHVLYILYVRWPVSATPRKPKGSTSPARCCRSVRTCRTLSNALLASSPSRPAKPTATCAKPSS